LTLTAQLSAPLAGGGRLWILKSPDALAEFENDLSHVGDAYGWAYLIDPPFCRQLFLQHLTHSHIHLIVDNRQKRNAIELMHDYPTIHFYTWSSNRTLHSKTFLFPHINVTWISSYNFTLGSYSMSHNHAVRIESLTLARDLFRDWRHNQKTSKLIPQRKNSGQPQL
jgi:hypothetical protein